MFSRAHAVGAAQQSAAMRRTRAPPSSDAGRSSDDRPVRSASARSAGGYNLDMLDELENADVASASDLPSNRAAPHRRAGVHDHQSAEAQAMERFQNQQHTRARSPGVPGGGRPNYNMNFVDYENESTDGEDSEGVCSHGNFDELWAQYWRDRTQLVLGQLQFLNRRILQEGGVNLDRVADLASVEFARTPESVTECSVCLDEFQPGDRLTALPCGHHFHPHCIRRALRSTHRCPYCRFQIPRGFAHVNDYIDDDDGHAGPPDTGDESDDAPFSLSGGE